MMIMITNTQKGYRRIENLALYLLKSVKNNHVTEYDSSCALNIAYRAEVTIILKLTLAVSSTKFAGLKSHLLKAQFNIACKKRKVPTHCEPTLRLPTFHLPKLAGGWRFLLNSNDVCQR